MQHFAKCRRVETITAFCLNSTLSTQNEERVLETNGDNKGKIILDQDSLLEKRYLNFWKMLFKKDSFNNNETKTKYIGSDIRVL